MATESGAPFHATTPARRRYDARENVGSTKTEATINESGNNNNDDKSSSRGLERFLRLQFHAWQRRIPLLKKIVDGFYRIPPRVRYFFLIAWVLWKFVLLFVFLRLLLLRGAPALWSWHGEKAAAAAAAAEIRLDAAGDDNNDSMSPPPLRILYIVTALAEYNTGTRNTRRGQDRLGEVLLPVLVDGVESLVSPPYHYHVDVYLILAYSLRPERRRMIVDRLPPGVGLQVWDDAAPLGYDARRGDSDKILENTRALARQHRYVIKDKLQYYDLFVAFEDDMRITGPHVQHFWSMSQELDRLQRKAPEEVPDVPENGMDPKQTKFFGQMTRKQMKRLVPGFVRVEVLLNETLYGAQTKLDPIPLDYEFTLRDGSVAERHIDPSTCCHVPNMQPNNEIPERPAPSDVIIWETNVKALSLRHLPGSSVLDWVVLLLGPGKRLNREEMIGGYWSGRDGVFGDEKRPSGGVPELIAQQGGWMATRDQIERLDSGLCMGKFLPPFDQPIYYEDGQQSMNVEFWSGGYQFFTGVRGGCNMQRLISFHPDHFSKHLIYHVANNKQRQLPRQRMLKADHLFGQLNTVKKAAEKAMAEMGGT